VKDIQAGTTEFVSKIVGPDTFARTVAVAVNVPEMSYQGNPAPATAQPSDVRRDVSMTSQP